MPRVEPTPPWEGRGALGTCTICRTRATSPGAQTSLEGRRDVAALVMCQRTLLAVGAFEKTPGAYSRQSLACGDSALSEAAGRFVKRPYDRGPRSRVVGVQCCP